MEATENRSNNKTGFRSIDYNNVNKGQDVIKKTSNAKLFIGAAIYKIKK